MGAYWQLKKYHDFTTMNDAESLYWPNGTLELTKLKELSRSYAQAVAGLPLKMSFEPTSGVFELEYNATISAVPTEVYFNEKLHYPSGVALDVQPPQCATIERMPNRVHVTTNDDCLGQIIRITLR